MNKVKFKEWNCNIEFHHYTNDRIAIELIDSETNEPILVATVNIPEANLKDDEVIIKTYSENEGIYNVLFEAGIIGTPIRFVQTGFVIVPVCKLLIKP